MTHEYGSDCRPQSEDSVQKDQHSTCPDEPVFREDTEVLLDDRRARGSQGKAVRPDASPKGFEKVSEIVRSQVHAVGAQAIMYFYTNRGAHANSKDPCDDDEEVANDWLADGIVSVLVGSITGLTYSAPKLLTTTMRVNNLALTTHVVSTTPVQTVASTEAPKSCFVVIAVICSVVRTRQKRSGRAWQGFSCFFSLP